MVTTNNDKPFLMPEGKYEVSDFSNVVPPPSNKSLVLWRYLDLAELVALLSDKKLHLARADAFQDRDRHEGSVTNSMMEALKLQLADRPELSKQLSGFRKLMKESVFISCWSKEPESEAMWKLYCGDNYGVAITVIYRDIEASLINQGLFIAPVQYLDYQVKGKGFPQGNLLYPFFHKRIVFDYEREVRIVKWCSEHLPGKRVRDHTPTDEEKRADLCELKRGEELKAERGTGIPLEFDVEALVKNIVVHPYAPEWYFRVIKLVVEKFTPILVTKLRWSSMKTEPYY